MRRPCTRLPLAVTAAELPRLLEASDSSALVSSAAGHEACPVERRLRLSCFVALPEASISAPSDALPIAAGPESCSAGPALSGQVAPAEFVLRPPDLVALVPIAAGLEVWLLKLSYESAACMIYRSEQQKSMPQKPMPQQGADARASFAWLVWLHAQAIEPAMASPGAAAVAQTCAEADDPDHSPAAASIKKTTACERGPSAKGVTYLIKLWRRSRHRKSVLVKLYWRKAKLAKLCSRHAAALQFVQWAQMQAQGYRPTPWEGKRKKAAREWQDAHVLRWYETGFVPRFLGARLVVELMVARQLGEDPEKLLARVSSKSAPRTRSFCVSVRIAGPQKSARETLRQFPVFVGDYWEQHRSQRFLQTEVLGGGKKRELNYDLQRYSYGVPDFQELLRRTCFHKGCRVLLPDMACAFRALTGHVYDGIPSATGPGTHAGRRLLARGVTEQQLLETCRSELNDVRAVEAISQELCRRPCAKERAVTCGDVQQLSGGLQGFTGIPGPSLESKGLRHSCQIIITQVAGSAQLLGATRAAARSLDTAATLQSILCVSVSKQDGIGSDVGSSDEETNDPLVAEDQSRFAAWSSFTAATVKKFIHDSGATDKQALAAVPTHFRPFGVGSKNFDHPCQILAVRTTPLSKSKLAVTMDIYRGSIVRKTHKTKLYSMPLESQFVKQLHLIFLEPDDTMPDDENGNYVSFKATCAGVHFCCDPHAEAGHVLFEVPPANYTVDADNEKMRVHMNVLVVKQLLKFQAPVLQEVNPKHNAAKATAAPVYSELSFNKGKVGMRNISDYMHHMLALYEETTGRRVSHLQAKRKQFQVLVLLAGCRHRPWTYRPFNAASLQEDLAKLPQTARELALRAGRLQTWAEERLAHHAQLSLLQYLDVDSDALLDVPPGGCAVPTQGAAIVFIGLRARVF
ncbi:unnamed protein product [Symbiodinium microadriaticum]|nr:unnamed protein product [Symbiodinium microadriaticum]